MIKVLLFFKFNRRRIKNIFTFACNYFGDGMLYTEYYSITGGLLTHTF